MVFLPFPFPSFFFFFLFGKRQRASKGWISRMGHGHDAVRETVEPKTRDSENGHNGTMGNNGVKSHLGVVRKTTDFGKEPGRRGF